MIQVYLIITDTTLEIVVPLGYLGRLFVVCLVHLCQSVACSNNHHDLVLSGDAVNNCIGRKMKQ